MPEFDDLQSQLPASLAHLAKEERKLFVDGERIKKLGLAKERVGRSRGVDSDAYRQLVRRQRVLQSAIDERRQALAEARLEHGGLLQAFDRFTDPRRQIEELSDRYPLLLLPVRIETRFKVLREDDGSARHQLWVRVFPDECSIDTFDDVLSESEIAQARNYWTALWKAGTADTTATAAVKELVREKQIGAWRKLMGHFNAGRTHWITTRYRPENEGDIPTRQHASDVLLVIPTDDPPLPAEQQALETYWAAVYRAAGRQSEIDVAFASLAAAAGGDEAARRLAETYPPQNLDEEPLEASDDPEIAVVFLEFDGDFDSKITAWSQAAKVRTFPERFVLLGYQGNDEEPVVEQIGARVPDPLIVGPDTRDDVEELLIEEFGPEFADLSDEEKAARYVEYLSERSETRWMFDFDRAVEMGLGFRVDLTRDQWRQGFTRLMVVGVRLGADHVAAKEALEELLRNHQFGDSGFSLLPQGTPTNNTEDSPSGHAEREDAEEAYERYQGNGTPPDPLEDPLDPTTQRDGRRLAEILGIDAQEAGLPTAGGYYGRDQLEARAMHAALWNATLGYFLESMAPPLATEAQREIVRSHLIEHVRGRGGVPSVRIGDQPYGILPISDLSNLEWLEPRRLLSVTSGTVSPLRGLYRVLLAIRADLAGVLTQVARVGTGDDDDAHQILLRVLGLHAASVEFDRRIAQSFDQIKNALYAQGLFGDEIDNLELVYKNRSLQLLQRLGYKHDEELDPEIPILERSFLGEQEDVDKPPIDDRPLSELRPIRAYTDAGENYIEWLIANARTNHDNIRRHRGFTDSQRPQAILYDLLRHAVNLEFGNAGIKLHEKAQLLTAVEATRLRVDKPFIGVQETRELESKWDLIYREDERIAPAGTTVATHIGTLLRTAEVADDATDRLREVVDALELLKDAPTARLERCMVEHLDCCHYRLDAWLLSFLHWQLALMRSGEQGEVEQGIYLGAYGWVEDLTPDDRVLTEAELDETQREVFDPGNARDLVTDSDNAGYVHAPSLGHGLTAAVLRNAYLSAATPQDAERYKVNLSSERVRMALEVIEGIQQGQGLPELLGYRLERGLHDNNEEELDVFIYELRKVFSLASNRLTPTAIRPGRVATTALEAARFPEEEAELEEDRAVTKVEARNVVNGVALLDHIERTGKSSYPFGFETGTGLRELRAATDDERDAIDAEVDRIKNVRDALADLAIAESVHQVVQGNYDRAAGALDAYSKGDFPQLPEVVQSPGSGAALTHRFGIHLPAGVPPAAGSTPRAKAEPALNAWIADLLPPAAGVMCELEFRTPAAEGESENPWTLQPVSLADLGLEPIDLLYLHDTESEKNLNALDDEVMRFFRGRPAYRPHQEIRIHYTRAGGGDHTFFELGALLGELRRLALESRPLEASDMVLQNEGSKTQNAGAAIDSGRILGAKTMLDGALGSLESEVLDLFEPLVDLEDAEVGLANFPQILAAYESGSHAFVRRLTDLGRFGTPGAGSSFLFGRERAVAAALFARVRAKHDRWVDNATRYGLTIAELTGAADEAAKIEILHRAEALISATHTTTFVDAADLQGQVAATKVLFDGALAGIATFLGTDFPTLKAQFDAAAALVPTLEPFDPQPLDIAPERRLLVVLVEDLVRQARALHDARSTSSTNVQSLLGDAATAEPPARLEAMHAAGKELFGDGFRLLPEFSLSDDQALELQNCLGDLNQLLAHQTGELEVDLPVDEWLYGVARVRAKLAAWENLVMVAEALKDRLPLDLTPFQLPYRPDDSWLALSFPESRAVEGENLLYTAYAPGLDPTQPQVGLLVDEWTEVVPDPQETTALTFHYDRPNCEAPQSMLLVTPASMDGSWRWGEVVASLHEALEMARLRALEPDLLDATDYPRLLPATVATFTFYPVTMALSFVASALTASEVDDG